MHPWNVDLRNKSEMGRVRKLLIGFVGGWYRVSFVSFGEALGMSAIISLHFWSRLSLNAVG